VRETYRTGDEGHNFTETVVGDAPSSVEISVNAKGQGQISVKLYYQNVTALLESSRVDLANALNEALIALGSVGIPLANQKGEK